MANRQAPALSVIVPLYNDEKYIRANIRSILANAQYVDLEVIVIDDGSTDNSREVATAELAASSVKHKIITKPNGGLSSARNTGLTHATGTFVAFLDSDDFVAPDVYSKLVNYAQTNRCDQVFARSMVFDDETGTSRDFFDAAIWGRILNQDYERSFFPFDVPDVFCTQPKICSRIWLREFLITNHLDFPDGKVFEDIGVHLRAMAMNGQVGIVNSIGLYYREGHKGRITSSASEKRFDVIDNALDTLGAEEVQSLGPVQGGYMLAALIAMVFWCRMGLSRDMKMRFDRKATELFPLVRKQWIPLAGRVDYKVTRRFLSAVAKFGRGGDQWRARVLRGRMDFHYIFSLQIHKSLPASRSP